MDLALIIITRAGKVSTSIFSIANVANDPNVCFTDERNLKYSIQIKYFIKKDFMLYKSILKIYLIIKYIYTFVY